MTKEATTKTESVLTREFLKEIRENNQWAYTYKISAQQFRGGFPDSVVILNGEVFFIEFKRGRNQPTPAQLEELKNIKLAGGNPLIIFFTTNKTAVCKTVTVEDNRIKIVSDYKFNPKLKKFHLTR